MFKKLAVILCLINIVTAGNNDVFQTTISPVATPTAPQLDDFTVQNDIPLDAKVLQSQQAVSVNPSVIYTRQRGVVPYFDYLSSSDPRPVNPAAIKITSGSIAVPVGAKRVTIEGHQQDTTHGPAEPAIVNDPVVQYVAAPIVYANGYSGLQLRAKDHEPTVYVTSKIFQSPNGLAGTQHPIAQYITEPVSKVTKLKQVIPVAAEKVTIEAHRSDSVHPPSPLKYIQTIVNHPVIQYIPASASYPAISAITNVSPVHNPQANQDNPTVIKPVAVPVIYNTEVAAKPQYIALNNNALSVPDIVKYKAPVAVPQSIPVPVLYSQRAAPVRYKVPVVYSQSSGHASALPLDYHIPKYTKTVAYSPASEVSSVRFTGLGVSYSW